MQKFSDPVLAALHQQTVASFGKFTPVAAMEPQKYFQALCASIVSQQLSTKVADVIFARLLALFVGKFTPENVIKMEHESLRGVGLSNAKAKYIKNIAEAWQSGEIIPEELSQFSDEAVIEKLVKIKGVGKWTAEMFLIFTLGRTDVFSVGDFALRKAVSIVYNIPMESKPVVFLELSEKWQPNRSLASRILWKSLEKVAK